jgi:hypothetical protein
MSDQTIDGLWISIVAGLALLAVDAALKWAHGRLARGNPVYRVYVLAAIGLCWILFNTAYAYFFPSHSALFIMLSCAAAAWIMRSELHQFWGIGLVGADAQIRSGIDFARALRLVSNSMDFLGVGAAKLTSEAAFEETISRCQRPGKPVRFLLCRPSNEALTGIAQSADHDPQSYQRKVKTSLNMIAKLRNSRAWNIEVRFYHEFPIFRLMFIDDSICLASHYVLGKGAGAELPQLHIVRLRGSRDIDSLYYAFSLYFERLWEQAETWDFASYPEDQ